MAKKRALSIKAVVTQNSLDSDGNTISTNVNTYMFSMENFVYDYIKGGDMLYVEGSLNEGLYYLEFDSDPSEMLDSLDTIFNSPDTLEDKTLTYKGPNYEFTEISVKKYNKELFTGTYKPSSGVNYTNVNSAILGDTSEPFAKFVRHEFLLLSDEAYNKFMEVWKDKITKTLNSIFPDLVGEITLVFTNSATTEE